MKLPNLKNNECLQMIVSPNVDIWILSHEFLMEKSSEKNFAFTKIQSAGGEIIELAGNEIKIQIESLWTPVRICNVNINTERRLHDIPDSKMDFAKKIAPFMIQCFNGAIKNLGIKASSPQKSMIPQIIDTPTAKEMLQRAEIIGLDSCKNEWRFVD